MDIKKINNIAPYVILAVIILVCDLGFWQSMGLALILTIISVIMEVWVKDREW